MSRCSSCDAEIIWAKTITGKAIPLDAKPLRVAIGELAAQGGTVVIRSGYVPHFATCPQAAQHRKPKPVAP